MKRVRFLLYKVEVSMEPQASIRKRLYSSKLVKRLLITANPAVKEMFVPKRGVVPKLQHITPLYINIEGKTKTILYVDQVREGQLYTFYVGLAETEGTVPLIDAIYCTLYVDRIEFSKVRIKTNVGKIIEEDLQSLIHKTINTMKTARRVKLVFASPTVLRDPLVPSKYKTLIPSVFNLFSTPVYITLYLKGSLRKRTLIKSLLRLHKALSIPPTYLNTIKKINLQYEPGRKVPALIGYINLHYNPENDPEGVSLSILEKILPATLALGTGVGRAAGLGHITFK